MRLRSAVFACVTLAAIAACAAPRAPDAQVAVAPSATFDLAPIPPTAPAATACPNGQVADSSTHACITACGAQPTYPKPAIDPVCEDVTLKSGQHWHDQLTVQLSSGATTRLDCPRMRFRGQDTPVCVTRVVGGQKRGACCPPGHTDPTDPECVAEGSVDEMFKRKKVWEWCSKDAPLPRPCEPCVWVTGAER
jgi:hypothetical protein